MTTSTATLTDRQFDIADAAEIMAESSPIGIVPSDVARRAKVATWEVRHVLDWMVKHQYLVTTGNGVRTRYYSRRAA